MSLGPTSHSHRHPRPLAQELHHISILHHILHHTSTNQPHTHATTTQNTGPSSTMAVLGSGRGNSQDEENAPLVLSPDRAARRSSGTSPLAAGRAAWFGSSVGGARNEHTQTHASQPPPQSYGAFVKSTNHGSMGTTSSHRGEDIITSSSTPGGSRLHRLRDHWPVLVELMASYVLVLAGFSSHSSPWVVGLVFAGM